MREVLKGLASFAVAALGFAVVVANAKHLTTPILIFGGAAIAVALWLAFRTDMEAILSDAVSAVRAWRGQAS